MQGFSPRPNINVRFQWYDAQIVVDSQAKKVAFLVDSCVSYYLERNPMSQDYQVLERVATHAEYVTLCTAVGWQDVMNFEAAQQALPKSLYGVVVQSNNETIGMGRLVGDGAIFYYVQDIAVLPDYQRQGVGSLILEALMTYIRENAPAKAFVGLFAAHGSEDFYRHFGFDIHEGLRGMFTVTPLA